MAGLPCAGTARRADRLVGRPLHPGQHLLIGSVPAALASRDRLHRPTYDPLASHLSLLSGGLQLRARSRAWTGRVATDETSSVAGASSAPGAALRQNLSFAIRPSSRTTAASSTEPGRCLAFRASG